MQHVDGADHDGSRTGRGRHPVQQAILRLSVSAGDNRGIPRQRRPQAENELRPETGRHRRPGIADRQIRIAVRGILHVGLFERVVLQEFRPLLRNGDRFQG